MGRTILLEVPEETYKTIEQQAEARGMGPAEVVIEWLTEATKQTTDPLEALIGSLECDVTDVAEQHDRYVGQVVARALRDE